MSTLCDLALVFGLTLGGHCQSTAPEVEPMPANDPTAWAYKQREQPPPRPEPKPAPNFGPIVIEKKVIVERPAPTPEPKPEPKPVEKSRPPSNWRSRRRIGTARAEEAPGPRSRAPRTSRR